MPCGCSSKVVKGKCGVKNIKKRKACEPGKDKLCRSHYQTENAERIAIRRNKCRCYQPKPCFTACHPVIPSTCIDLDVKCPK